MKRVLLRGQGIEGLPCEYENLLDGARIFDSSCSPEARVYFIEKDSGYYLKRAPLGSLSTEAKMTRYFNSRGLGAQVLSYESKNGFDWLMTERIVGEDSTHAQYLSEPKRLASLLGEKLRELHSLDFSDCPVSDRMESYRALAEKNHRLSLFDGSFFGGASEDSAWREIEKNGASLNGKALLHGDYCLPNIMLDDWRFSGFIDVGNGGVGDPHIDLFWGAWTLNFNLGTDEYRSRFFDAYGRDAIEEEKLVTVGAYEAFG